MATYVSFALGFRCNGIPSQVNALSWSSIASVIFLCLILSLTIIATESLLSFSWECVKSLLCSFIAISIGVEK